MPKGTIPIRKRTHANPNNVMRVAYRVMKNPSAGQVSFVMHGGKAWIERTLRHIFSKTLHPPSELATTRVQHVSHMVVQLLDILLGPSFETALFGQDGKARIAFIQDGRDTRITGSRNRRPLLLYFGRIFLYLLLLASIGCGPFFFENRVVRRRRERVGRLAVDEAKQVRNEQGVLHVGESRQSRHFGVDDIQHVHKLRAVFICAMVLLIRPSVAIVVAISDLGHRAGHRRRTIAGQPIHCGLAGSTQTTGLGPLWRCGRNA